MQLMSWWQVEAKVKELREVSAGDDSAAIKAKIEELQKEVMAIGQVRCCAPADACDQAQCGGPSQQKGSLPFRGCHHPHWLQTCRYALRDWVGFFAATASMGWDDTGPHLPVPRNTVDLL